MKIRTQTYHQSSLNRQRWLRQPIASGAYQDWLIEAGSLTAKLKARYADFKVEPVKLAYVKAGLDECSGLSLKPQAHALVRDVLLYGNGRPVVFAHSVLPVSSLRGDWHGLGRLGNQPLGEALFANPKVQRTPLMFKKLHQQHALYQKAAPYLTALPAYYWARRSIFTLNCANILVTEVFLPTIADAKP